LSFAALDLRAATLADTELLWRWANDPAVRAASFNSAPLPLDTHADWLARRLEPGELPFFVAEIDGSAVGYAHLERFGPRTGEVSLSIDAPLRGRGLGAALARGAAEAALADGVVDAVVARVKADNAASQRAFAAAGYVPLSAGDAEHRLVRWPGPRPIVPHSRPFVGEEEAAAAAEAIVARSLGQGPRVRGLERRWAEACGVQAAAAVGSGLAALRLALAGLGVGPGDEVVVPAYSCVALLNAPLSLGATPVLADVLLDDWTLDPASVERVAGPRTKAIVGVDLFGVGCDLEALATLGPAVVEDCAHGVGGARGGRAFGGGGDASITSFYATKMLGAGEGGAVASRDGELIDRVRAMRDYGDQLPDARNLNDKLSDVEAAVALVQLDRLDEILQRRARAADRYAQALAPLAERGLVVLPPDVAGRIWYRYAVRLAGAGAASVCARAPEHGVVLEQPVWDLRAAPQWRPELEVTGRAFDSVVSLPLYPDLSTKEQDHVIDVFTALVAA
jgi:perosamine synthetase